MHLRGDSLAPDAGETYKLTKIFKKKMLKFLMLKSRNLLVGQSKCSVTYSGGFFCPEACKNLNNDIKCQKKKGASFVKKF